MTTITVRFRENSGTIYRCRHADLKSHMTFMRHLYRPTTKWRRPALTTSPSLNPITWRLWFGRTFCGCGVTLGEFVCGPCDGLIHINVREIKTNRKYLQCHGFHHRLTRGPNHSVLLSHRSRSHRTTNCRRQPWVVGESLGATEMSHLWRLQLHVVKLSVSGVPEKQERCCGKSPKRVSQFPICIIMSLTFAIDACRLGRGSLWNCAARQGLGCAGVLSKLFGISRRADGIRSECWRLCCWRGWVERQVGHVEWVCL